MATKPSDLLPRLPSVNELLEKPPVKALADRWNRSAVAAGVRSFLHELRSDLERRAAEIQLPTLRDLAERAARHVTAQQQSASRPAINATGRFFGSDWTSAPLADVALERMIAASRGWVPRLPDAASNSAAAQLCRLTGAEAATIVGSYCGAVSLAIAALAQGREVVVARSEVGELADGGSLMGVVSGAGALLREVGTINRLTASDYEPCITERTAAILRHAPERYRIEGDTELVDADALVGLARDRELPLVELLGSAPLVDDLPAIPNELPSAAARIAAGAHLVIVRGDGLVGGPRSGILLGTRQTIEHITSHPLHAAWQIDAGSLAALDAILSGYDDPHRLTLELPLFQLLATSVENLRQRAERLAPQLAAASDVASARAVECESCLGLANCANDRGPSFGIALVPADGQLPSLEKRLRNAPVPIIGRRQGDKLLLDLKTVLPRQDQTLVDMLVGPADSAIETGAESAVPATG